MFKPKTIYRYSFLGTTLIEVLDDLFEVVNEVSDIALTDLKEEILLKFDHVE